MDVSFTWLLKITKRSKSRGESLAVAQVLLCQVGSKNGMVLCVYMESSWFLVSRLVCRLIPEPRSHRASGTSLPQHGSHCLATPGTVDLNLSATVAPGRLIQYIELFCRMICSKRKCFQFLLLAVAGSPQFL